MIRMLGLYRNALRPVPERLSTQPHFTATGIALSKLVEPTCELCEPVESKP